ncbi:hypothetical protein ABPG74_008209 [Tetrahymena malaccensis]
MNFQINLSCSNHPQKKVEFFAYNLSSNKYELVCSRCVSKLPKETATVDTEEVFSQSHKYITNWPPLKNEQLYQQIQKKLENQDEQETQTEGNSDSQTMFTRMKDQFQEFLINFEANLKNQPLGGQLLSQKYQKISQSERLLYFIKNEVSKKEKFQGVCQDFKSFLKQNCQNNSTDEQLEQALENLHENPQEKQIAKLQQAMKTFKNNYKDLPQKLQKIQTILQAKKKQIVEVEKEVEMSSMFEDTSTQKQYFISMNHFYEKCLGKKQTFKDHFKHQLEFTLGQDVFCSKCSPRKTLNFYWACQQCKYYLCLDCTQHQDQFQKFYDKLIDSRLQKTVNEDKKYYGYVFLFATPDRERDGYCNTCSRKLAGEQKYTWYIKHSRVLLCIVCAQHFSDIIVEQNYFSSPDIPLDFFNPNYIQFLKEKQQYIIETFINPANNTLKRANQLPYIEFVVQAQQNLNQQGSIQQIQNQPKKVYQTVKFSEFYKNSVGMFKKFQDIDFRHDLQFIEKNAGSCKLCIKHIKNYCWYCQTCNFYVCLDCIPPVAPFSQFYENLKDSECDETIEQHKHNLIKFQELSNQTKCSICTQDAKKYAWKCSDFLNKNQCMFNICLNCSSNFSQVKIDVSKQIPIIPIDNINKNNNNTIQSSDNLNNSKNISQNNSQNLNQSNTIQISEVQNIQIIQDNQLKSNQQDNQEDEILIIKFSDFFKKNLQIQKKFPKIDFKHDLTFIQKEGKYCKVCSRSLNNYCWSCEECDYYVCINCITIESFDQYYQKLINSECDEQIGTHLHSKMQFKKFSQIYCNSCRKDSQNLFGWECSDPVNKCNFIVCIDCSSKFSDVIVDTKVYKSLDEIPVKSSLNVNRIDNMIQQKQQQLNQQDYDDLIIINFQEFFKKNLNVQKKFPKIDFKHDLTFIEKDGKYCTICSRSINNYCWSCESCGYYVCMNCITIDQFDQHYQKLINSECDEKIGKHSHTKMQFKHFSKIHCDSCRKDSKILYGWECSDPVNKCNFIVCIDCSSKFGEVMVDTKFYKQPSDIPIQNNSLNINLSQNQCEQQNQQIDDEIIIINFSDFFKKNVNLQKRFPKIDFKHDLTFVKKDGKYCKICSRSLKNYCWTCDSCDYDICVECITIESFDQYYQKLINTECDEQVGQHRHSKMQFKKFTKMHCDQCRKDSKNLFGWECSDPINKCNFTVCIDCSSQFGDVMVDTKVYKSKPEITAQSSQNSNNNMIQQEYQQENQNYDEDFMIINFSEFFKQNLNIQRKFPQIDFKHDLKFIEKDGKYCKMCSRKLSSFSWSCESCDYYVCIECISIDSFIQYYQKLVNSECDEKIVSHRHSKMQFKKFSKMNCDLCRKDSKNLFGWECSDPVNKCNFTVCIDCSSKFADVMVDTKVYKSIPENFIQNTNSTNNKVEQNNDLLIVNFQEFFQKNLNIQKKFPQIDFKHDLKFIEKNGKYCKLCSRQLNHYCWSCDQCDQYVCVECISIDAFNQYYQKLINSECDEKIGSHRHSKMQFTKFTKMTCDLCRKDSKNLYGWKCSDPVNKCNFTLCIDCSSKFGDVMVDIKIYQSQPEILNQLHQNNNNCSNMIEQDIGFTIVHFQEFFQNNINIQKKFPKIDFKHDLKFIEKKGKYCKLCSRQLNHYCWSCDQCDYYVCIECISIDTFNQYYQKLINSECDEKIESHKHSKMLFKKFTNMRCDQCSKDSKNLYGWECSDPVNKCNFTLCIDCSSKFSDVMIDPKVYNSIPEIPIQNNQNIENMIEQESDFTVVNFQDFFKKNLNIQKKFPKIDFKHDLKFIEKNGKYCKLCSRQLNHYCWSCDQCDYCVCVECISIDTFNQYYQKLINSECDEKIGSHRHSKMQFKKFTKMSCDQCRKDSKNLYGWQCSDPVNKCNFTLCIDCSSKFGDVMIDPKVYNSIPEISIQNNQNMENMIEQENDFMIVNFQEFFKKNLNTLKKFPKIDFKHDLKFIEKNGKYCKLCSRQLNHYCWSCDQCDYYVCIECISIDTFNQHYQKLINSECDEKIGSHRHSKMQFTKFTKMTCDLCRKDSKNLYGWKCSDPVNKCNFTLCIDCSSKFGDTMVDIKVYKSIPDIPIQNNQNIDNDLMIVNFQDFFNKNLNIQKKFPKIDFKHNLKFIEKNGKYCKLCSRQLNNYCWSCDQCDYYICIECISIDTFNQYYQKLINSECDEKMASHRHSKMKFKKFTKMSCDQCRKDSINLFGWECSDQGNKCNFTICINCSCKFGDVMVDTKIYQSIPDINPQINNNNEEEEEDFLLLSFQLLFKNLVNLKHKFNSLHYAHDLSLIEDQKQRCNLCSQLIQYVCWSCKECELFVCLDCIPSSKLFNSLYNQLLNSEAEENLQNLRHKKFKFSENINKQNCDNCRQKRKGDYGWVCTQQGCGEFVCLNCSSNFKEIQVNKLKDKQEQNLLKSIFNILKNKENFTDSMMQEIYQYNRDEQDESISLCSFESIFKNNLNLKNKLSCHNEHDLQFEISKGGYCQKCVQSTTGQHVWNCQQCNKLFCINCTSMESDLKYYYNKFLNSEYDKKIGKHAHVKFIFRYCEKGGSIRCDICNRQQSNQFYYWSCATCDSRFEICLKCSQTFNEVKIDQKIYQSYPDPPQRQTIQQEQKEEQKEEENLKLNINQYFLNCINTKYQFDSHSTHELVFQETQKGNCRKCDRSLKSYSWRCEQCNYSLCLDCSSTMQSFQYFYSKIVKAQYDQQVYNHKHNQITFVSFADGKSGKRCDICSRSLFYYGWKCGQCSFDLCLNCSGKFETVQLDLEVYKSQPNISQNQIKESEKTVIDFKQFFQNCLNVRQMFDSHKDHELVFTDYQKGICKKCDRSLKSYSWRCEPCNYSLCLDCTSTLKYFQFFYNKLVKSSYEQKLDKHNHSQVDFNYHPDGKSGRRCDFCSKSVLYYGWKCPQCSYDVCLNCSGQFGQLKLDMQVYNSQPNVPQVFTNQ